MKNLMVYALLLFVTLSYSQEKTERFLIEKGNFIFEGDFHINSQSNDISFEDSSDIENDRFDFSIAPKIGYAINDNLILGLGLGYAYSKAETTPISNALNDTNTSTSSLFDVFPYIKKFFPLGKKLALHAQGEARFTFGNTTSENGDSTEIESDSNSLFIGVRPGFSYQITNAILVHANFGSLGYSSFNSDGDDNIEQESENFRLDFGTSTLQFGFALVF